MLVPELEPFQPRRFSSPSPPEGCSRPAPPWTQGSDAAGAAAAGAGGGAGATGSIAFLPAPVVGLQAQWGRDLLTSAWLGARRDSR